MAQWWVDLSAREAYWFGGGGEWVGRIMWVRREKSGAGQILVLFKIFHNHYNIHIKINGLHFKKIFF